MRTIILAVAATAAVAVPASPASAAPPPLAYLRKVLLTEAEAPTGYRLAEAPENVALPIPRNRSLCRADTWPDDEPETTVVMETFEEEGGTSVLAGVAAPGGFNARTFVTVTKTAAQCPDDDGATLSALALPPLGDAAAGFREVTTSSDGTRSEGAVVAVADGDLVLLFEMGDGDESDEAEFLAFVSAGARKLAGAG